VFIQEGQRGPSLLLIPIENGIVLIVRKLMHPIVRKIRKDPYEII